MILRAKNHQLFDSPLTDQQLGNSKLNLEEDQAGKVVLSSYPRRLVFELTNDCDLQCIMCGRTNHQFSKTYFKPEWLKIFSGSLRNSEEVVLHGWGEPLISPYFAQVMKELDEYPVRKYFVTNGMHLDEHMETLFAHRLDILAVSLDGARAETNNRIRIGSDFEHITESIRRIVKYREEHKLDYPYINLVLTAMKDNIDELPDMIDLAADLGIEEVKLVYLTVFDKRLLKQSLYGMTESIKAIFDQAEERAAEKGIKLKLPYLQGQDPAGAKHHRTCHFPYRDLFVGSDGFVRPCVSNSRRLFHVSEMEGFNQIWNHSSLQELRETVNHPDIETPECLNCYHSSCANWNRRDAFERISPVLPDWGDIC